MIFLYYYRIPHFLRCGNKKIIIKYKTFGHPEYIARGAELLWWQRPVWWPGWHSDGRYNSLVAGNLSSGWWPDWWPGWYFHARILSDGGVINRWPGWHYDGLRMMWLEIRLWKRRKKKRKMPRIIYGRECAAICIHFFLLVKTTFGEVSDTCLPSFPCIKRTQTLYELMLDKLNRNSVIS